MQRVTFLLCKVRQREGDGFVNQQNEADGLCDVQAFPMATGPAQHILPAGPGWGEGPKG